MSTQLCQCAKNHWIVCFSQIMWFVNFVWVKLLLKRNPWDFLGCPVVKTLCSQRRGHRFSSWSGNWDPTRHRVWPENSQISNQPNKNPHKAMVVKTVWWWHKTRHRSMGHNSPEINLFISGQLIYDRKAKNIKLGKGQALQWWWENWATVLHHTQKLTQLFKDWNIRPETITFLEENIGDKATWHASWLLFFWIWHWKQRQQK